MKTQQTSASITSLAIHASDHTQETIVRLSGMGLNDKLQFTAEDRGTLIIIERGRRPLNFHTAILCHDSDRGWWGYGSPKLLARTIMCWVTFTCASLDQLPSVLMDSQCSVS